MSMIHIPAVAATIRPALELARSDKQHLVPVLGAGTSIPLGSPSWPRFIERIGEGNNGIRETHGGDPTLILRQLKNQLHEVEWAKRVRFALSVDPEVCSSTLQALVLARPEVIVTTNLDYGIENAFAMNGRPFRPENVVRDASREELFETEFAGGSRLLKIHGSLERARTWVLTKEDYDRAYVNSSALRDFFIHRSGIPFFLGFGFSDFDVNETLRFAKLLGGKRAYSLMRADDASHLDERLRSNGVIPIYFFSFDQIPEIIDEVFGTEPLRASIETDPGDGRKTLRVGGAKLVCEHDPGPSDEKLILELLCNAIEPRPNESLVDGTSRRLHGIKGEYVHALARVANAKKYRLLSLLSSALVYYPEILLAAIPVLLSEAVSGPYDTLQALFDGVREREPRRRWLEDVLLGNLANEKLGFKQRRAVAKVLGTRQRHPAQQIKPLTVRIGTLQVARFPLTRFQVGVLRSDHRLSSDNPLHPYTILSLGDADDVLHRLRGVTGVAWRLPTPAEWRCFARLDAARWPWGDEDPRFDVHGHLHFVGLSGTTARHTLEVGIFPAGNSPNGLSDLIGNVYELLASSELAGGAWTTRYKPGSEFRAIREMRRGHGNVGLRPVYDEP